MSIVKLNNKAVSNATSFGSITSLGSMTFIKKLTASGSATLSFVDGTDGVVLDDTYKEYVFTFKNIHPATNSKLQFQVDTGTNTSYNQTVTNTNFRAFQKEDGSNPTLTYQADYDQAQGTSFVIIGDSVGTDNDENIGGSLQLFNPSSDTFVKHFISRTNTTQSSGYTVDMFIAGYFNTQTPLTRVQFKMSSGNIDAGDICLYGIA